jgi:hypothetical protein
MLRRLFIAIITRYIYFILHICLDDLSLKTLWIAMKHKRVLTRLVHNMMQGHDGNNVISTLRSGSAAVNAAALMKERGYTNRRKSRHRLTPGTVKFAAFHVLSLEGSKGLTILEVAEKIQVCFHS